MYRSSFAVNDGKYLIILLHAIHRKISRLNTQVIPQISKSDKTKKSNILQCCCHYQFYKASNIFHYPCKIMNNQLHINKEVMRYLLLTFYTKHCFKQSIRYIMTDIMMLMV